MNSKIENIIGDDSPRLSIKITASTYYGAYLDHLPRIFNALSARDTVELELVLGDDAEYNDRRVQNIIDVIAAARGEKTEGFPEIEFG